MGEAAGQTKTTTGGGISYGLACADLAAEVVRECFERSSFGPADLAGYERRWKALLQKEILVGHYTRRMCARLSDGRIESLFQLARTDGIVPIIRDKADFDWHSGLIFALLQRLSFMGFFREVRDRVGPVSRPDPGVPRRRPNDENPMKRTILFGLALLSFAAGVRLSGPILPELSRGL